MSLRIAWDRCDCENEQQSVRERGGGRERKAQKVWQRGINCLKKNCKRQMWWRKSGYTQQAFYSLLKQPVNCPIGCDMDSAVNFCVCVYVPACSSREAWPPVHWWYSLVHEWIGLDESESLIRERSGGLVHCCRTISCTGTWPRVTQTNRCWDLATTLSAEMFWHTGTEVFGIPVSLSAVIKSKLLIYFQRNWS